DSQAGKDAPAENDAQAGKDAQAADASPTVETPGPSARPSSAQAPTTGATEPRQPSASGPSRSAIDESDPRRIFAFADSLEAQNAETEAAAAPSRIETWVTFNLADEIFALPVEPVNEVVRVASITRVPHAPRPIRGVTNMRGRVIPVIDLRLRIELPEADLGRASRVIVVSSRGRLLGLLVDAVQQVIHIDLNKVQAPPDDVMTIQSDYLVGVYHLEDQLVLLLDIHRVLIIQEAGDGAGDAGASNDAGASPVASRASSESAAGGV
ncbi:MAG: chemotaxis protein CheW, partial [Acidobacteriota bacterium]